MKILIVILSGTADGRWISGELARLGYRVLTMAPSVNSGELPAITGDVRIEGLPGGDLLGRINAQALVDCRHPLARNNGGELAADCEKNGVLYLAVGCEETHIQPGELMFPVHTMQEAAEKAAGLGKTVFLTTGSHGLEYFTKLQAQRDIRVVVRVLPEHRVIKKCQDMNIRPKDIVAMQGPFSKQINKALFKMYRASVVVTKDSGQAGGTDTKIEAALALKIPVVLIKRNNDGKHEFSRDKIIGMIKAKLPPG